MKIKEIFGFLASLMLCLAIAGCDQQNDVGDMNETEGDAGVVGTEDNLEIETQPNAGMGTEEPLGAGAETQEQGGLEGQEEPLGTTPNPGAGSTIENEDVPETQQ